MVEMTARGFKSRLGLLLAGLGLVVGMVWLAEQSGPDAPAVSLAPVAPAASNQADSVPFDVLAAARGIVLRQIELQAATADRDIYSPECQAALKTYVAYVHDFPAGYTPTQRVALIDCFATWLYTPAQPTPPFEEPPSVEPFDHHGYYRKKLYEHYVTAILALGETTPPPSQPPVPDAPAAAENSTARQPGFLVLSSERYKLSDSVESTEAWLIGWDGEPPHGGEIGTLLACLPPERCRALFVQGVALTPTDARRKWEVKNLCRTLRWLGDARTVEALLADRPPSPPEGALLAAGAPRLYWDAAVAPTVEFLQVKAALSADDRAVVEAFVRSLCGVLAVRRPYQMHAGPWRYQHNMLRARWPKLPLAVYRVVFEHPSATVEDGGWVLRLSEDLTAEDIQQLLGESDRLHRLCADLVSGFQVVPALLYRAKDPWFRTWLLAKEPRSEAKWAGQDGETVQWLACYAADAATAGTPDAAVLARLRQWSDQTLPATALPALKSLWAVKDPGVEDRVRAHLQADPREETKLLAAMIDLAVAMNLRDQMPGLRPWLAQRDQEDHSDHEIRCAVLRAVGAWKDEESRKAVGIIAMDDRSWEQGYARLALQALDAPPKLALPEPTPPVEPPEPPAK